MLLQAMKCLPSPRNILWEEAGDPGVPDGCKCHQKARGAQSSSSVSRIPSWFPTHYIAKDSLELRLSCLLHPVVGLEVCDATLNFPPLVLDPRPRTHNHV